MASMGLRAFPTADRPGSFVVGGLASVVTAVAQCVERPEQGSLVEDAAASAGGARLTLHLSAGHRVCSMLDGASAPAAPSSSPRPELGGPEKRSALLSRSGTEEIRSALLSKSSASRELLFPVALGWSHYLILTRVANEHARTFYEIEAVRENWSTRELERQIASLLYERLAKSREKDGVLALAREGHRVAGPRDILKDPVVLEFLELEEQSSWLERDLEQAIIDRIEAFLLELGKGFCFVARQKRLTLDQDHFYVDLVFYNRLLRCFVLIDLKLGKLTHQDLGQMQMCVNYFDRFQREEWEAPTGGIVLCLAKNDAMVRITLPADNEQIHAARYQLYLPTEEELRDALTREREEAEHALQITNDADGEPP
jgi:predicted nuclease of restriction endonuclease-like (RecB) superfamily